MYPRTYSHGKGNFNWTLPSQKGQPLKSHAVDICSDRCSHPLFSLILILSTFLAMSAAILTVSEYWAIEAQSGGNEPCSGVDFNRGPIGTLVMPKSWERFKDRRILFVSNSKIDQVESEFFRIAKHASTSGAFVSWLANKSVPAVKNSTQTRLLDHFRRLSNSQVEMVPRGGEAAWRAIRQADLVLAKAETLGNFLEGVQWNRGKEWSLVSRKFVVWVKGQKKGAEVAREAFVKMTSAGALLVPLETTGDFWKREAKRELGVELSTVEVVPTAVSHGAALAYEAFGERKLLRSFLRQSLGLQEGSFLFTFFSGSKPETEIFLLAMKSVFESSAKSQGKPLIEALVVDQSEGATSALSVQQFLKLNPGLNSSLKFVELTTEKVPYLLASDAVVFSPEEQFEFFLQEIVDSMFLHVPILATDSKEFKEILQNGTTALLHPKGKRGFGQLAKNIWEIATNYEVREELTANGHTKVRRYLYRRIHEKIAKIMRKVMKNYSAAQRKDTAKTKLAWEIV